MEGNRASLNVGQPEVGSCSTNSGRCLEREAGPQLVHLGFVEGNTPHRSGARELRLEFSKLLVQAHFGIASRLLGVSKLSTLET